MRLHHRDAFAQDEPWRYAADFKTDTALSIFDRETTARGTASKHADWRANIVTNFERLVGVLSPE